MGNRIISQKAHNYVPKIELKQPNQSSKHAGNGKNKRKKRKK